MKKQIIATLFITVFLTPAKGHAWGERGHHLICEVATRLVKEPNLQNFLQTRGHAMGHLCNIPDIHWRDVPEGKPGDEAHFINPENAGISVEKIPTNLADYFDILQTKDTPEQKAEKLGTLWWRADQLFSRAVTAGTTASTAQPPKGSQDQQDPNFLYNKGVYNFLINIGLMGHFVGDASMPYHNSADYDGWKTGHGGIHSFYETNCVAFYGMDLITEVEKQANALYSDGAQNSSPVDIIRAVSLASASEKKAIEDLDHVLSISTDTQDKDGNEVKVYAKRDRNEVACPPFRPLIVKEMARSAVSLANLWDKAYVAAHKPALSYYRMYLYPLAPDFVPVDYLDQSVRK